MGWIKNIIQIQGNTIDCLPFGVETLEMSQKNLVIHGISYGLLIDKK